MPTTEMALETLMICLRLLIWFVFYHYAFFFYLRATFGHSLLFTRRQIGVPATALIRFRSYISDHRQFVSLDGYRSEMGTGHFGVPQGSILGPLTF